MRIPQFQNNILVVNGVIIVVWLQLCSQVAAVSNPLWILETKSNKLLYVIAARQILTYDQHQNLLSYNFP